MVGRKALNLPIWVRILDPQPSWSCSVVVCTNPCQGFSAGFDSRQDRHLTSLAGTGSANDADNIMGQVRLLG